MNPIHVGLVRPLPADAWLSIERYADCVTALGDNVSLRVDPLPFPLRTATTELSRYRLRYRDYPLAVRASHTTTDVIHITDQALGHLVTAVQPVPTVVTCHDILPFTFEGHYAGRFHGWFDRTLLGRSLSEAVRSARFITVSRFTASALSQRFGVDPARIDVVPDIVDEIFRPVGDADSELRARGVDLPRGPRVLSVGHSRPYKNLELLLHALAAPGLSGGTLVRAGAPLTAVQTELAARLGIAGRIVELGTVDAATLTALYGACDVLAQPSWAEGFGLPVAEAMACGLPVVSSDGGALPEVVGDAGIIVPLDPAAPADNALRLAQALERAITDSALRPLLAARGLHRVAAFRPPEVKPLLLASYARTMRG